MRTAAVIFCVLLLSSFTKGYAQVADSTRARVRRDLENALEGFDPANPDLSTEQLTQLLQDLASRPVNINKASVSVLMIIPGINLKKAQAIVHYRKKVKAFENVDELLKVKGIGEAALKRARSYVTVGSGVELAKQLYTDYHYWSNGSRFTIYTRYREALQKKEGFRRPDTAGGFLGNRMQYYQRFQYQSKHLEVNLTQQKDAGEPFSGTTTGFDYSSWHVALEDNGKLRELVVGDYALYIGQGLVFWSGRTFGKGRDVIGTADRSERGVNPYSSSSEAGFFRGIAATYGGKFQVTGFYSNRSETASKIGEDSMRMPKKNGYHRTALERSQRNDIKQKVVGGRLRMQFPFGFIGVTGYQTSFNKMILGGTRISDHYDFNGRINSVFGADYNIVAGPAILFGEAARSQNGGLGFIIGVESPLGDDTKLTAAYRDYGKNFQSFLGNGFGEQSGAPKNEKGFYVGLRHSLSHTVTLSAYFDQYHFPAPRYRTVQPTSGHDWLGLVQVAFNPQLIFYAQVRSEIKEANYEISDKYERTHTRLGKELRSSLRAQLEYQVNPVIRLRTRGEVVRSRQAGAAMEYGSLMYQDVQFTPTKKWTADARITVFDTDSYDTRLYQFESGLLYVLSNEMLYGQGERMYAVVHYRPLAYLEIWAKWGVTVYEHINTIGSGLNEIQGNKRSHVGVEVRLRF